jgi:hypothetical protein
VRDASSLIGLHDFATDHACGLTAQLSSGTPMSFYILFLDMPQGMNAMQCYEYKMMPHDAVEVDKTPQTASLLLPWR